MGIVNGSENSSQVSRDSNKAVLKEDAQETHPSVLLQALGSHFSHFCNSPNLILPDALGKDSCNSPNSDLPS